MHRHRLLLPLLVLGAAACAADPQTDPLAPSLGKAAGGGGGDPVATFGIPQSGLSLRSDGKGDYLNGQCSVTTSFLATEAGGNTGDAILRTLLPKGGKCGRTVTLEYALSGETVTETLPVVMNIRALHNTDPSTWIAVGNSSTRRLVISPQTIGAPGSCGRIIFGPNPDRADGLPTFEGTDPVLVTRVNASTWRVHSGESGSLTAYCELQNQNVEMTLDFTVRTDRALQVL